MDCKELLKKQHAQFIAQRDQLQVNFQQLVGAIFACEGLIKQLDEEAQNGEQENGQAVEQS